MQLRQYQDGTITLKCNRADFAVLLLAASTSLNHDDSLGEHILRLAGEFNYYENNHHPGSAFTRIEKQIRNLLVLPVTDDS